MHIFANDPDLLICPRLGWMLPHAREDYRRAQRRSVKG